MSRPGPDTNAFGDSFTGVALKLVRRETEGLRVDGVLMLAVLSRLPAIVRLLFGVK